MKITNIRTLRGTNVYHSRPVLVTTLELEEKTELGSHQIPEFTKTLIETLPGLWEHHCSPGRPGGFIERLNRGTYFAHIVEHIALELSVLAGIEVSYGKSVYGGAPGRYSVVTRFKNEEGMKRLLYGAVDLANAVFEKKDFDVARLIDEVKRIVADSALGPSAQALADAAEKRKIPWRRIGEGSLLELGYGSRRRRVQTAVTDRTGLIATDLVQDKDLTKQVLDDAFIPVPRGIVVRDLSDALKAFGVLRPPFAVKPLNGHHGNGVSLNVMNEDDLRKAYAFAREEDSCIVVERMCRGKDYRVLVLDGKVIAAAERIPAHVVGNGRDTVRALVEETNRDPRRGEGHCNVLTRIEIDQQAEDCLIRQSLTADAVPEAGRTVFLKETGNLSTGGTARDVTDLIHPEVRSMCERAARAVGLDLCGLDLIHSDISAPIDDETAVIEVNAGPGLRMHVAPTEGKPRDVGGAIIDSLYPDPSKARIPIFAVTGTNGKTTVARLAAHLLSQSGFGNVGLTTTDGIYIDGKKIATGDMTGPRSTRVVLADPTVDCAVLEVARGGLLRGGLGYDWSDVGVVTNVRPDHIGQDGIETIEDLVKIKSIVAERVRAGGTIVLNADDTESSQMVDLPNVEAENRKIIFYALNPSNPLIRDHLNKGGRALFVENGFFVDAQGTEKRPLCEVSRLSLTMRGLAWFQVSNALAAIAGVLALGADHRAVAAALTTFKSSSQNLGRMNLYRVRDGFVILDYGHNPDAIEAMSEFIRATRKRSTAILGLPGDRADDLLRESAKTAAKGFDRLILRDDTDRRGRAPGEVPRLICETVKTIDPALSCETVLDESEALKVAIERMNADEVVVLFYDEYERIARTLRAYDPVPIDSPDEFFRGDVRHAPKAAAPGEMTL